MDNKTKLLSIKMAAEMLEVTPLTLRNWDKAGKLKPLRHPINNYRVYRREDIENLLGVINTNTTAAPTKKRGSRKLDVKHINESPS